MYRESAYPGPNALDSSSYTNLNGDPQAALKQQYADQTIVADINTAGSQDIADSRLAVRELAREDSQDKYKVNTFLANFMADRFEEAGGGQGLENLYYELAAGRTNNKFMGGTSSQIRPYPTDLRGMLPEEVGPSDEAMYKKIREGINLPRF